MCATTTLESGPTTLLAGARRERTKREENEGHCSTLGSFSSVLAGTVKSGEMVLQVQFLILVVGTNTTTSSSSCGH